MKAVLAIVKQWRKDWADTPAEGPSECGLHRTSLLRLRGLPRHPHGLTQPQNTLRSSPLPYTRAHYLKPWGRASHPLMFRRRKLGKRQRGTTRYARPVGHPEACILHGKLFP